jgi:Nif-specific regulatory protein
MQTKLLRTLQEGTVVRLGGQREVAVDVRLVAATHRDLDHEVRAGRFRRDLYYRLNVIPIRLPALRERREDIATLALHFVSRANQAHQRNVHLSASALERLAAHDWPGNIRELGNVIERLVLLADHPAVSAADLERFLPGAAASHSADAATARPAGDPAPPPVRDYRSRESHTAQELAAALQRHGGNQSRAAQSLGLTPRQFAYRWQRLAGPSG